VVYSIYYLSILYDTIFYYTLYYLLLYCYKLDIWLSQWLSSCPVDILPGVCDPANIALPQQPFHPCLFSHAARFSSLERVTNPYQCQLDHSVNILGHSGQPIQDIARLTYGALFPIARYPPPPPSPLPHLITSKNTGDELAMAVQQQGSLLSPIIIVATSSNNNNNI
jgi:hypothetical protein